MVTGPVSPNFGGRFEYLSAIQEHWPEVLSLLRRDAFRVLQEHLQRNPGAASTVSKSQIENNALALESFAILSRTAQCDAIPELQAVHQAIRKWADAFGIRDEWMLDAAVQSLRAW